jgi:hypothetical protein
MWNIWRRMRHENKTLVKKCDEKRSQVAHRYGWEEIAESYRERVWECSLYWVDPKQNPVAGYCEHDSESSNSLQYRKFPDKPNDYYLFKKASALCSLCNSWWGGKHPSPHIQSSAITCKLPVLEMCIFWLIKTPMSSEEQWKSAITSTARNGKSNIMRI